MKRKYLTHTVVTQMLHDRLGES